MELIWHHLPPMWPPIPACCPACICCWTRAIAPSTACCRGRLGCRKTSRTGAGAVWGLARRHPGLPGAGDGRATDRLRSPATRPPIGSCCQQQRWPDWDGMAWQQHVAGFALEPHLEKPGGSFPTGTQRKFWQAAALASGAAITLIDAPDAGLDSRFD